MVTFELLDWIWVGIFVLIMIGSGILFYRLGKRSESDFFLAGRGLPWWLPASSVYATHTATDTPMWVTGVIVVAGTVALAWRPETRPTAWSGLFNGAVLTTAILAAILAYILIGWDSFFTRFHQLLFPAGSWTFAYSEGLIRLFPEKFWFDVGVMIGGGTLVGAILIGAIAYLLGRR